MRQVGTLSSEREARQFAAWLVAQRIEAHAEHEGGDWIVWVRDEDQLAAARESLAHFRENPGDPKYRDAERSAEAISREDEARRRQAQGNVVEMRGRWGTASGMTGVKRKAPVVMALIGVCALVAVLAYDDTINRAAKEGSDGSVYRSLVFVDPAAAIRPEDHIDIWASIRQGQVWRLLTPVFIHYDVAHIVFNLIALYSFGSLIEDRRGTAFFLRLFFALAILSDVGQALESGLRGHIPAFGGMSGVVYGLFGYVFIKSRFDSREPYFLSPGTTFIAMLWFALCILRDVPPFDQMLSDVIPPIANTAHAVGLITGAAIAYVPILVRKPA
jgi:GlpG protein